MIPTLLIDCHYFCHRAMHTFGGLNSGGDATGVIYGFLNQLKTVATKFETNKVFFNWDSKESLRKEIFPGYKKRDSADEITQEKLDCLAQFPVIRNSVLPFIGFKNSYIQTGYEADDLTAKIVMSRPDMNFVMVTPDEDHFQLLDFANMYAPAKDTLYTSGTFKTEWDIFPREWAEVKAVGGCTSDKVPGIAGVGEKTAVKWLKKTMNPKTKAYAAIVNGTEIIERNRKLVTLPFPGTKLFTVKNDECSMEKFITICKHYEFNSFLSGNSLAWWEHFLEGAY